jgi:hypothetical protein
MATSKTLNTKKGKVNDTWKNWAHIDGEHFAYIKLTDSLIRESILHERKVDTENIRYEVALIFKRPWTGFRDNETENSSVYCSYVKKAYWEGRIDQFIVAELIPGKDAVIHEVDCQAMQVKAQEIKQREEALAKLQAAFANK